jgi:hypothetical protein
MEKLLMNIASNGNLPPETMKAALEETSGSQSSSSHAVEYSTTEEQHDHDHDGDSSRSASRSVSAEVHDEEQEQNSDTIKHTNEIKTLECLDDKERVNEPFSYVGSSSGIYLLSRLFPKDNAAFHPDNSEALPRPLEGHEDDLMVARFGQGDKLNKLGFGRNPNPPDWKLPPKELTDHLVDM